ncbi:F-actin-monooxygenase Mical isoform X2 [Ceratitis capitata]|uniref:F-actin-monooxygenase Mical isoform X2 n=1 Tax=Ceratitis capitata TaxID=7213 RepID=UPI0006189742|nr:F-actin-monooxygenase Mical isoform X2 [Ceratitis capitata]XP_012156074.1 F-actin-monooxygenase Mical isoform X2 [Ceratitis capitata]XP_012156075.1 F-actin-monooxygenase Mical isoform X2 [Ceratitis capitata]XP_020713592.1 F-actin-monooxygenase Mical isoform X2 [Ceratitis capitata]
MSRPSHQRTMPQPKPPKQYLTEQEAIAASELFDLFCVATTMRQILGLHRDMCDILGLRPSPINEFYPMLKAKIRSWKAQALWKKFDARAAHRVYAKGTACNGTHVLVIGSGPCGLRTAIEAQLLGAKVVVLEKRDRITRNNVLHLWPFVITDLRNLGAKKFYGKFCAGSIDHISIRQLQIILMKVALLLGVEIHENVSFERTIEPSGDGFGWRAAVTPADHVVSYYEFDVLIGADGKRNTLEGFRRKEFRGKLAIAITANFINKKTEAEAKAEEISGVAFIFNQSFFKELYEKTGIDLENIVYYKDETHYFVMTAKKHSLIDKGVILQDFSDPAELLAPANVSTDKLLDYAREAAEFSTKYQMPNLEFAVNHYGKPDVAMFDFTSMFAAETSCRVMVRHGHRLLQCLVGDSLLEPFWPTGSGCARGFLSSMDAAYATKLWSNTRNSILGVVAQRESIYRLLNQTTPENLQRDTGSYTVDPASRYPNLNRTAVNPLQVKTLVDSDDPKVFEQPIGEIITTPALAEAPALLRKARRSTDIVPEALLHWVCTQLHMYDFAKDIQEPADILKNGKSLCALISRFRPDLIDYTAVRDLSVAERNEIAFRILETEYQLPRVMSGEKTVELGKADTRLWLHYLNQVRELFRGEVPYLKHPKMDITELREKYRLNNAHAQPDFSKLLQFSTKPKYPKAKSPIEDMVDIPQVVQRRSVLDEERVKRVRRHEPLAAGSAAAGNSPQQGQTDTPRRAKKRRNAEKAANIEERQKRLQEIEQNRQERQSKRRQQRYQQTQNFYKSLQMLQVNTLLRETDDPTAFDDYSLFIYRQQAPEFNDRVKDLERKLLFPDRNRGDIPSAMPRNNPDEQFSDRIKSMEQRISSKNACGTDKKPKDLMRAIGKIDSNDWNVREIEKKIEQSKRTEIHGPKGREKVPKWSKEQFLARQNKMAKPTRQESVEEKFKEIDQTLKNLDKQLKEGSILEVGERGRNKVASIAGQFVKKDDKTSEENLNPATGNVASKPSAKVALAFKKQAASEKCHFCKQTVYLMEKVTAEELVFHRSCLKCHHCQTNLRPGGYTFDRDDPNGRFYCTQHFRLPAKAVRPVARKPGQRKPTQQQQAAAAAAAASEQALTAGDGASGVVPLADSLKTPDKLRGPADNVVQLDLMDRGQTPERIEFENTDAMSDGEPSEEHILDEHEWSGRNFLPESNQDSESDLSSSDDTDSESDAYMFGEANDSPLGAQTLQLATDWIGKQHYSDSDDSDDFYDSSDGIADDDGKDDTEAEGEDFKKARERRREEVRLLPLPANLPTDTETEVNLAGENEIGVDDVDMVAADNAAAEKSVSNQNLITDIDKRSEKSEADSDKSFKSADSTIGEITSLPAKGSFLTSPPTKADIEKLEQSTGRRFSAEIEAINEKLHRLNSVVKMSKDLETIAKENLVKSDILKKLTMKEKWLADNSAVGSNSLAPKSAFDNRFAPKQVILKEQQNNSKTLSTNVLSDCNQSSVAKADMVLEAIKTEIKSEIDREEAKADAQAKTHPPKATSPEELLASLKAEIKSAALNRQGSLKRQQLSPTASPSASKKLSASTSRSNSFKEKEPTKNGGEVSRTNSLKRSEKFVSKNEAITNDSRMQIQNILGLVKSNDKKQETETSKDKPLGPNRSSSDMGKLFYDAESKFSPKVDRRLMQEKLKEIEAKSFSGTMDAIKSQMVMPTVSAQANPSVDLSKYFPDQKQQKSNSAAVNKNQKNLKDVDLAKYFPSSPTPQRRSTVVTVADKLKKSQTENAIAPAPNNKTTTTVKPNKLAPKKQASLGDAGFSLRDHQLDGAVDLSKKSTPLILSKSAAPLKTASSTTGTATVTKTTAATAAVTKKGNIKIIKKIVPKKKTAGGSTTANKDNNKSIVPRDETDRVLDEILQSSDKEMHSPSAEYLQLFKEEKSPSEDVSDKVERIFQETGIDLAIAQRPMSANKKRLLKTKSLGEGEFELNNVKEKHLQMDELKTKEDGDRPIGVQGLLARFESMSSVKSSEQSFKLRRMESNMSNLTKSRESIISHDSIMSRESDSMSDLEKTMEYLKSEWRNEATNFLQNKRENFFSKKRAIEEEAAATQSEAQKKTKYEDLPVQYRESKIAKFFGIKSNRSPEKTKAHPLKTISPEKKIATKTAATVKKSMLNGGTVKKSLSPKKQTNKGVGKNDTKTQAPASLQLHTKDSKRKSPSPVKNANAKKHNQINGNVNSATVKETSKVQVTPKKSISPPKHQMEDYETTLLVEKGSMASSGLKSIPINNMVDTTTEAATELKVNGQTTTQIPETTAEPETVAEHIILSHQNSTNSDTSAPTTPVLKRRPLVEDIRNLPKTGCDKSLSNSRRNSQTSLHSRRCSDVSLQEKLDTAALKLTQISSNNANSNVEELFQNIVERLSNEQTVCTPSGEECDSLRTSISKSPSAAPTTVRMRGSSEDESIEKLFSQFSDEMLVNVEFDSNDELIGITPRVPLPGKSEENDDFVDRLESLEKDEVSMPSLPIVVESVQMASECAEIAHENGNTKTATEAQILLEETDGNALTNPTGNRTGPLSLEYIQSMLYMEAPETPFPSRPQRRQKSTSSSSETSVPIAPQRIKHKLAKLRPENMPPSVQDLMQNEFTKSLTAELAATGGITLQKFPRNISEDELEEIRENRESTNGFSKEIVVVESDNQKFKGAVINKDEEQTLNTRPLGLSQPATKTKEYDDPACQNSVSTEVSDVVLSTLVQKSPSNSRKTSLVSVNGTNSSSPLSEHPAMAVSSSAPAINEEKSILKESPLLPRKLSPPAVNAEILSSNNSPVMPRKTSISKSSPLPQRKLSQSSLNDRIQSPRSSPKHSPVTKSKLSHITNNAVADSPLMQWRLSQALADADASTPTLTDNKNAINANQNQLETDNLKTNKDMLNAPTSSKASSKERSLEWDMTKMPASPMPRRKFIHAERRGLEEARIKDVSPTSSIKILNNLSSNSSDSEERRIIEDFEKERRQALIQRDKEYQKLERKEAQIAQKEKNVPTSSVNNSNNNSKGNTPRPTPLSSRRGTQDSINSTQRECTPPNFKKLVIPTDTEDLPSLSSRCSSFAFIELMSNGEAREAPMPQKLKIPPKPQPITLPQIDEPVAEVFRNRPWPKPDGFSPEMDTSDSPDTVIEVKRANSEPKSPVAEVFRNRKWPDGKTVFDDNADQQDSDEEDFLRNLKHNRSRYRKMQSHSPQPMRRRLTSDELNDEKSASKSVSDLHKKSPSTSETYESELLPFDLGTRSTRSSAENSSTHTPLSGAGLSVPKRPTRHVVPAVQTPEQSMDASTRMLLDRSKRLHNRKSEFINERAAERNPYLRDVVKAERIEREAYDAAEEDLDCYRPNSYRSNKPLTRFPTSRTLGRERSGISSSNYNYAAPAYGTDYGLSNKRLYGSRTLPGNTSTTTSLNYNPYISGSSAAYGGSTLGRNMHFNDYTRRSPSRHHDREHSRESCVIV